ncbi:hypothetical protein F2Q69_00056910 [Brassica cretica]|uniref:Uncharacterized protein n=1 Tax=Brassica cretica TaxID=69181 RepID=A0A8S9MUK7_BRACR|nr:hypothetical protein F2Q69_00056910 [Brassica cretica]
MGNGGSNITGFAGFRPQKRGGSDNTVLSSASSPFQRFWASRWSFGRAFSLILTEDVVDFRWISDDCSDGGCILTMWWGFDLRTRAPLMVFRSRRGGRVTRVPSYEDLDTCPVHATRVNEEAPLGLG